jgi:fluoride exporter
MSRLLLVCLAGGIGSVLRYGVVTLGQKWFGDAFPWGVLGVNIVGSFLLAFVSVLALSRTDLVGPEMRVTLSAGFMGGLTTYSSFNQDTLAMIDKRAYGSAAMYVVTTLLVCLVAGALGTAAGRRL